ncbi:hypothetical protein HDU87_004905 [Geranomyces variabilis]|uniref:YTH domain-containing protein n=1 Tax=Geranomyces variabilis TaxID=109894 RepID=A0AAD5TJ01_9FUNG|nr:hypothetical protein HDU87_004905 [Geranomyces variabilis]
MGTVNILDDILGAEDDELDFDFAESKSNQPEEPHSQPPLVSKRPSPALPDDRPRREAESEPPSLTIRNVAPPRESDVTRGNDARPAVRSGEGGDSWRPATRAAGPGVAAGGPAETAGLQQTAWQHLEDCLPDETIMVPGAREPQTGPRTDLVPRADHFHQVVICRDILAGTRADTPGNRSRPQAYQALDNEKTSTAAQGLSSSTKNAQGVKDNDGLDTPFRAAAAEEKGSQQSTATPVRLPADRDRRSVNVKTPDAMPRDTGRPPSTDLRHRDDRVVSQVNKVPSNAKDYISEPRADTQAEPRDQRTVRRVEPDQRTQNREPGSSKGHVGEPIPFLKDANQGPHEIRTPAPSVPDKLEAPAIPMGVHPERLKAMGLLSTPAPVASPVAQRAYAFKRSPEASPTARGASITDRLGPRVPDLTDGPLSGNLKRKRHEEKGAGEKESRRRSEFADRAPGMLCAPCDWWRRPGADIARYSGATGHSKAPSRYFILFYPDRAAQQQSKAMNKLVVNPEIARKLRAAFEATRDIILLFIVGNTRSFCGYARMVGSSIAEAGPALHLKWETDCNVHREIVRDRVKVSGGRNPLRLDFDGEEVAEQEGQAIQVVLDAETSKGEHVRPIHEPLRFGTGGASDR